VVYILGAQYRYEVTEIQIKRCLNEIMDLYRLKKVKVNKLLKANSVLIQMDIPMLLLKTLCEDDSKR
jgi:hypothetical protein